tara:strand:+ start:777 stop:2558 length:1782 start_codon:yes stop_codon:yes gene_type:complete
MSQTVKSPPKPPIRYGLIGAGQLGKLLIQDSNESPMLFNIYSNTPYPLSRHQISYTQGDLQDRDAIIDWALDKKIDVLTYEIENVNIDALQEIKKAGIKVIPDPNILAIIQNKLNQKKWLLSNGFPTSNLITEIKYPDDIRNPDKYNHKGFVHKLVTGGYDGRGVLVDPSPGSEPLPGPYFVEKKVDIKKEISVVIGRDQYGNTFIYEPSFVVTDHNLHMLDYLVCPAPDLTADQITEIQLMVTRLAVTLDLVGILAVELFIDNSNKIYVNEMSPRPHNTGHHTIERYNISQNELLRRILRNKQIKQSELKINIRTPAPAPAPAPVPEQGNKYYTLLTNIVGISKIDDCKFVTSYFCNNNYSVHWYGKYTSSPGRKMGHITYHSSYPFEKNIEPAEYYPEIIRMKNAGSILDKNLNIDSMVSPIIPTNTHENTIEVAVIMGSKSDLPTVKPTLQTLNSFRIPYKLEVVSAHRTPQKMIEFAMTAKSQGYKVIIAAAGGAAHLPGMTASATTLPVIGIPVNSSNSIQGIDSLLSINQMPSGIPVATMAINGAQNAALYAIRILAISNHRLSILLDHYSDYLKQKVKDQNSTLFD